MRLTGWALGAALSFALVFPLLYAALVPERKAEAPVSAHVVEEGRYRIAVVDWGYHTALVLEQPPGARLGPPGEEHARFVEFAWGDRSFYYASDHRPHALYAAAALPSASAVFADAVDWDALGRARAVYEREVDAETLGRLIGSIESSFERAALGERAASGERARALPQRAGTRGRFFPSPARYLWTRNCNGWTVRRLQEAGLATSARGVVLSGQVSGRLVGFEQRLSMSNVVPPTTAMPPWARAVRRRPARPA